MTAARPMRWDGWGDPGHVASLPPGFDELLDTVFPRRSGAPTAPDPDQAELPPVRLDPMDLAELARVVGEDWVRTDAAHRARHSRGRSTIDLLQVRSGRLDTAPDAVVSPASHGEVGDVLSVCGGRGIAVVPFGGGTSVVGGVTAGGAPRRAIALDLGRMDGFLELDTVSRTATFEAGVLGPDAERLLGEKGFTLGHFPQSFEYASLGGFAATRSAGQASAGYGRFDDLVLALRVATGAGTLYVGRAPASAAGPDLRQLMLGSEGTFGVITAVTVAIRPTPTRRRYVGWQLPSFAAGTSATRALAQDGPLPAVVRLSDETETSLGLARPDQLGSAGSSGCLLITGFEGTDASVADAGVAVASRLSEYDAVPLGTEAGESWSRGRFEAPYLRDALLDAGVFVETLETAAFWSAIPALYERIGDALTTALRNAEHQPLVMCHISHVYPAGASLYFTVAFALTEDAPERWRLAKTAAGDAILRGGGTISHHHGVGIDHRDHYAREIGQPALAALHAVKRVLDPDGVLNPGVLLDGSSEAWRRPGSGHGAP